MNQESFFSVTDDAIRSYERDGVVCLRQVFDNDWIQRMRVALDQIKASPGPLWQKFRPEDPGEFFSDKFMWTHNSDFRDYIFESVAAELVGHLMRSLKVNIFFDQILVKEPKTFAPSPWHQDLNYWPFSGRQICSLWMPLDEVDVDSGTLEFIRGSHLWKDRPFSRDLVFANDKNQPQDVNDDTIPETDDPHRLPDIESTRDQWDVVSWTLKPGDALVFTALTLHSAPTNASERRRRAISTRWTGDDVRYTMKRRLATLLRDPGLAPGDVMDCTLFPVVLRRDEGGEYCREA